jgi:hypothetical protein
MGNTADVLGATWTKNADLDGDGLLDAVALFSLVKAEAIRAASDELDGPVGLHYTNEFGESFLVPDLLALPRESLTSPLGESMVEILGNDLFLVGTEPEGRAVKPDAAASTTPAPSDIDASVPLVTRLAGFRPNPFIRQTAVSFELVRQARVSMGVYSLAGAKIRGLVDVTYEPGRHSVSWDGRDDAGRRVSPGVYFVRFAADGVVNTGKALILP